MAASRLATGPAGATHMTLRVDAPEPSQPVEACISVPSLYLEPDALRGTGVVLGPGHDDPSAPWNGRFFTDLAAALAGEGYVVVRPHCRGNAAAQRTAYEAALDAAATSPFGRGIVRWVRGLRAAAAALSVLWLNVVYKFSKACRGVYPQEIRGSCIMTCRGFATRFRCSFRADVCPFRGVSTSSILYLSGGENMNNVAHRRRY